MKKSMFTLFALCIVLNGNLLKAQDSLLAFIHNEALSPDEYIIEKFHTNDVVLLGEHHLIKQNLLFVQDLIPKLYKHGIRNLGMEFGAQEVQDKLDSLVNAPEYDQDLAQETIDVEAEGESGTIAFNYHYIFGCLNALSKEKEITLELKSYSQAGIFKSYDKINYLYLVMPVRI